MKRLANCFSQLLILVIVSTFILQRGFDAHDNIISNLFGSLSASTLIAGSKSAASFAYAQYSSFESAVISSESYIDLDGKEKIREYVQVESYQLPTPPTQENARNHDQQLQQQQHYAAQYGQLPSDQSIQDQQVYHAQNENNQHRSHQTTFDSENSASSIAQQQQHLDQISQDYTNNNQLYQQQQPNQQQGIIDYQSTNENAQQLHHYQFQQQQQKHHQPQQNHNDASAHHKEPISHHSINQQQQGDQFTQQQNQQQHENQQVSIADSAHHLFMTTEINQKQAQNGQYQFTRVQREWRQESTGAAGSNEIFVHHRFESLARFDDQPSISEAQIAYVTQQHISDRQHYHQQNHHHHQQHQHHQQNDIQRQLSNDNLHQQMANDLHHQQNYHHHHHQHHHQQQQQQQYHHQQEQRFLYARHISDDHDYEAAHEYYFSGRAALPEAEHFSLSCNSIHESDVLTSSSRSGQQTCRAASTLKTADDPAAAVAQATDSFSAHGPSRNSNVESFPLAPQHYHYESSLMAAIRHYWREVGGLCIASAIFLNWLFVVVKRKIIGASEIAHAVSPATAVTAADSGASRVKANEITSSQSQHMQSVSTSASRTLSKDTNNTNSAHDSAYEENVSPTSLDDVESSSPTTQSSSSSPKDKSTASLQSHRRQRSASPVLRQRSSTLKADNLCCPSSGHASLSQSASLSMTLASNSEYISRYSSDFDSIQRLGRGGFGIVFEARNKIDDCHYAVKRICLPLEREARERVMREVRALAKLDHAGIVRYYNAWLETPPDDWLKQHDAQLGIVHSRDGMSFPSTDGIYDHGESDARQTNKAALGESGDGNSPDWFGTNNSKNGSLRRRRTNGYNYKSKFLRNNSSSPSLDIVFEGSGSIRLEAENSTKQTNSNNDKLKAKNKQKHNKNNGDTIYSDSEDSDFIQFGSRGNLDDGGNAIHDLNDQGDDGSDSEEASISVNQLSDPFDSTSGSSSDKENIVTKRKGRDEDVLATTPVAEARKKALSYQKEMRQLHNGESNVCSSSHFEKVYLYIQMQLCRKDTLKDWLRTNCENRDKTTIFDLFYQIVDAVEYVHSQDLIHRDLKPSNIFFSLDGTLKIGDFGLCRAKTNAGVGSSLDLQEYVAESEVERGFDAVHTEQVGTQLYMSPEQLNGLSYNQKVDIFAMGLILLELLVPFKTQMQRVNVLFKARNNLYSEEFKRDHPREYELVKSLLSRSPLKRPTATEIKQDELLANAQLSQPVIERIYHRRRTISSNSSTE